MNAPVQSLTAPLPSWKALPVLMGGMTDSAIADVKVNGLTLDSRAVQPGHLFLAVQGTREHGLKHLGQALENGCSAIAYEPSPDLGALAHLPVPPGMPLLAVEKLSRRSGTIASRFFGDPSAAMFVAGVTGTDGKTSTAHLIAQSFDRLGMPSAYMGTIGVGRLDALDRTELTTPDAVDIQRRFAQFRDAGLGACALEVSSHALDQERVEGVHFNAAVLTNVGRDHLDYHGSIQAYAAAKRRLFSDCAPRAMVLNRDDAYGNAWADDFESLEPKPSSVTRYGLGGARPAKGHWLLAEALESHADGLAFNVASDAGTARIQSRLLGRFNAHNLLASLGVLRARDIPLHDAAAVLSQAVTVPGRMEVFASPYRGVRVVVDYAHTPQALAFALAALRPHVAGRLICVFGCGGNRDRGKRPLMGAAAAAGADRVIVTDDNPRDEDPAAITTQILSGIDDASQVMVERDRGRAIERAVGGAARGDWVLVAGKGHEDYQICGALTRAFSDRAFVAALLGLPERAR